MLGGGAERQEEEEQVESCKIIGLFEKENDEDEHFVNRKEKGGDGLVWHFVKMMCVCRHVEEQKRGWQNVFSEVVIDV